MLPSTCTRRLVAILPWLLGTVFTALPELRADPRPGDVFREYVWTSKTRTGQPAWQRITGPGATMAGAKEFLPNPVNSIQLGDLDGAIRVEAQLELLQSHYGTTGHALRLNGGEWIKVPPSSAIPGKAGAQEGAPEMWLSMRYPTVEIPLSAVKAGNNVLEFTCENSVKGLGVRWPQSLVYGVIFRVYYGPDKAAPAGKVIAPTGMPGRFGGIALGVEPAPAPGRTIRRVDFLARYRGYDWRGDGITEDWHYHTFFGELRRHAGTAFTAPWQITWDIRDIPSLVMFEKRDAPAQVSAIQVMARIEDDTGLCRMTEPLTLEKFKGVPNTRIFAAYNIPHAWQSRAGRRHSCKILLPEDLSGLVSAKLILASWSGAHADAISLNSTVLQKRIGYDHDLSYDEIDVPISALKPGENEFHTYAKTEHHGIEVLWPGVVIIARFAAPNAH